MALGHVYALLGAIVFLATMVLAPYPLVTIGASEMLGDIINVPCMKSWLLVSDALSLLFPFQFPLLDAFLDCSLVSAVARAIVDLWEIILFLSHCPVDL